MHNDDVSMDYEKQSMGESSQSSSILTSSENNTKERHSRNIHVLQTELPIQTYESDSHYDIHPSDAAALKSAAEGGDTKTLVSLLQKLGGLNKQTVSHIKTALQLASSYGQFDVVCQLIETGVGVGPWQGSTCLHAACLGGQARVLEHLVEHVSDIDIVDGRGQTAVHVAALNGEVACLKTLYDRGASLILTDKAGNQPIHLAVTRNHRNVVDFLDECGVDLHAADQQRRQPIHLAARHGGLDCLISLVERNCDVTSLDGAGSLPIHFAAVKNHVDCVRFLNVQGTSLDVLQSQGKTPLHMSAENGSVKVLHWLLENGSEVNIQDKSGQTACHLAASRGHGESFNCLVQHSADLSITDNLHRTAMDMARKHGHPVLINDAISGNVPCPHCKSKQALLAWNASHPTPSSLKQVSVLAGRCYKSPSTGLGQPKRVDRSKVSVKRQDRTDTKTPATTNAPRSLAARYYGQYLQ